MSEIRRSSNSEEARQDSIRATQQRQIKGGRIQNAPTTYSKSQTGQANSRFDEIMEQQEHGTIENQGRTTADSSTTAASASFNSRLQLVQQHQEKSSHRDSDDNSDSDSDRNEKVDKRDSGENRSKETSGQGSRNRIESKENFGRSQQFSGEQQKGNSQGSPREGKEFAPKMELPAQRANLAPTAGPMGMATASIEAAAIAETQQPKKLPKAVLDQIIQAVAISRDKDLNEEILITFQDNFFNGTRLKIVSKNGSLQVQFLVPNRAVLATFKNEREELAETLGKKGIDVSAIEVELA